MGEDGVVDALTLDDTDKDLIRQWLGWGLLWMLLFPTIGAVISVKSGLPDVLGAVPVLTFERFRPIPADWVIWSTFSTLFVGLAHYIVPRLCGRRLWKQEWSYVLLWAWNLNLIGFVAAMAMGGNRGGEAGESIMPNTIVRALILLGLLTQFLMTIRDRNEKPLYVSVWYLMAAFAWTLINLTLLVVGSYHHVPGMAYATFYEVYLDSVVGLWLTPAGYAIIYYFLPASVKSPIYSHRLSLIGFWSLALFYPFIEIHHDLRSSMAGEAATIAIAGSMAVAIPAWTVLQNIVGTMLGRWQECSRYLPVRFLIAGSVMYLLGSVQGAVGVLRSLYHAPRVVDFVIPDSHLAVFGSCALWAIGGVTYVWPRIAGRTLWSPRLGNWSFWLVSVGVSAIGLVLAAEGGQPESTLMAGAYWTDAVIAIEPYWWIRTFTGISMGLGMLLLVYNLMRTSLVRTPGVAGS